MNTFPRPLSRRLSSRNFLLLFLLTATLLLASGCGGGPLSASWAGVAVAPNAAPDTGTEGSNGNNGDAVIVANLNQVIYINASTGDKYAEYPDPPESQRQFYSTPAVVEDVIYVGGMDGWVYALDGNGQVIWPSDEDRAAASPDFFSRISQIFSGNNTEENAGPPAQDAVFSGLVVGQGRIYFGVRNRGVVALDQTTGQRDWYFETGHGVWATPLLLEDRLIVTSLDQHIYALDPETGEEIWQQDLQGAVGGTPAYLPGEDDELGVLYVGSFAQKLYAISARDGEIIDSYDTNGWVWGGPALSEDGILYFGDLDGYVYALDTQTLDPEWMPRQVASGAAIRGTPLIYENLLIIGSRDHNVYAINRTTSATVWERSTEGEVLASPILLQAHRAGLDIPLALVSTTNPQDMLIAYCIYAEDCTETFLWRYPTAQ